MKLVLILISNLSLVLFAQIASASISNTQDAATTPAKDAYGCIGAEGYSWCVKLKQCVRPSKILIENNLELTAENFHAFCQNQQNQ
jgi:hypothetical protein